MSFTISFASAFYICFINLDVNKHVSLYFDNASPGQELNVVELYREHKKVGSVPTSWEEFNKAWTNVGGGR